MDYLKIEQYIADTLRNSIIFFKGEKKKILIAEKPLYSHGEGKTDIYCLLDDNTEIKISYKMDTADFYENKLSAERAKIIFGDNWSDIIINTIKPLIPAFKNSQIYFPEKKGNIAAGSYTMGWRCDLIKRKPIRKGSLTTPLILSKDQIKEIFSGAHLSLDKRNAKIIDKIIPNSGVANYFLNGISENATAQDIIDSIIPIEQCDLDIDMTFRRVNYRSIEDKIDGNRPLAVFINWRTNELIFDHPLIYGAKNDILKTFKEVKNIK